jgi:hypothetical protein
VFDLMMHVALGWKFRDRKVRQGAVVYCALEGCAAFKNRVEAFRQAKLPDNASEIPFHLMASPISLVADHTALIASIRAALVESCPAAVVIDTLNRSLAGSESDDRDMAAYVKAADAIRDAFNCVVIIVHHCGHEGTRPRGHSSLMGALDVQVAVKRDAADNIIATIELMKDGTQGDEFASRLEVIELGLDDDGDKITSCVIEPVERLQSSRSQIRPTVESVPDIPLPAKRKPEARSRVGHRPRVRSLPRVGLPLRPEIAGYQRSQIVFVSRFCRATYPIIWTGSASPCSRDRPG